jgi:hypothetical protein
MTHLCQVAPPFCSAATGFRIWFWCDLFDRSRESVPAWTKAVPSALFDRYREAYRRGLSRAVSGGAWEVSPLCAISTNDESLMPI